VPGVDSGHVGSCGRVASVSYIEEAMTFACEDEQLVAIIAKPDSSHDIGVLIVVGGPQYRAGSHRQFVLLSREMAEAGITTMRFDYRGMGDASGPTRSFDEIVPDIAAAISAFQRACPKMTRIVLWGLCDAASAALTYWQATCDARIAGIVLANPWVRSPETMAKARIKHYYAHRLLTKEFWTKVLRGNVNLSKAVRAFGTNLVVAAMKQRGNVAQGTVAFQQRMADGLRSFEGPVLLIMSGRDLTAKEFLENAHGSSQWAGLLERQSLDRHDVPDADHTFSSAIWSQEVENCTLDWLRRSFPKR
jgi:exosortase A-associated hydrolase 1